MRPGEATLLAAADYEAGRLDVAALIDVADTETARAVSGDRLANGSLDDYAADKAASVFARTVLLAERGWEPSCDLAELTFIHRALFDGVFDDAGRLRTANTSRASAASGGGAMARNPEVFFPAALIETGAHNIAVELAEKHNLQALDRDVFVREFTRVYDELGYLHPFRGGNAMTLRVFGSRLAHDAGWDLDWGLVERGEYRSAKHAAYRGDVSGFARMFERIVRPANPTRVFLVAGFEQGPAH